ncbi:MAG: phosphoribosylamine--glycine ligase [Elusimicrobia bacterium]|nr:phosphoribosylamine--glycine ligase [Candidatus Liberimonas magnetica]
MNVLVIGSGGREHVLVWKLKQSPKVEKIYCVPGNAGISQIAECYNYKINDFSALAGFVKEKNIDYTVVGPEVPLSEGLVDYFTSEGLNVFGPNKKAAMLEASKVFAKNFMKKYGIPTAKYEVFSEIKDALSYLSTLEQSMPLVVKANGLAAGKGVIICNNAEEARESLESILEKKVFGTAGENVVVEEFLAGEEVSIMVFLDGKNYSIMVPSQDHKRIFDNDLGPNTGGMGAYAPAPLFDKEMRVQVEEKVIKPVINGLEKEKIEYKGVLYIGLMISNKKPFVLEFNCRFGDPETQAVLPLLKTDLLDIIDCVINAKLDKCKIEWYNKSAVCVVLTSKGYPGDYIKDVEISGLTEVLKQQDVIIFHAGTSLKGSNVVTSGGRVLGITGVADNINQALKTAYNAVKSVKFDGMHYRKDIAKRAIDRN